MNLGGFKQDYLDRVASIYPIIAHGLSLSIGGFQPINKDFLNEIRAFLDDYKIEVYSTTCAFPMMRKDICMIFYQCLGRRRIFLIFAIV